ncbi:MAG: hypothetical protein ACW981_10370 [Candidatus Hodarchaeales archaeon]|jgi:hypothetical protein
MTKRKRRTTKKTKKTVKSKEIQKGVVFLDSIPKIPVEKRKLLVNFEFDDNHDLSNLLVKLNDIVRDVFTQGLNEAGYALAALHLNLMQSKETNKSDISLKYLKKLVSSYLQSLTTPYEYGILIHSYIMHWFRLVLIYEKKVVEWIELLSPSSKKQFEEDEQLLSKNLNQKKIFDIFPTFNPEIYNPEIVEEDELAINDLFSSLKDNYGGIGLNFAKFYILNVKRYVLDQEELLYIFQIQVIIGKKLKEIGVEAVEEFISGISNYFYQLNSKLEGLLDSISKRYTDKQKEALKKKWEGYSKFSGTSFAEVVNKSSTN